jgi:hypothetical protein
MTARRTNRVPGHRITWWVWGHGPQGAYKIPHSAKMRGTWGWDATCSCGWESRTGGATRGSVERLNVASHMWDVADDAQRDALLGLTR